MSNRIRIHQVGTHKEYQPILNINCPWIPSDELGEQVIREIYSRTNGEPFQMRLACDEFPHAIILIPVYYETRLLADLFITLTLHHYFHKIDDEPEHLIGELLQFIPMCLTKAQYRDATDELNYQLSTNP